MMKKNGIISGWLSTTFFSIPVIVGAITMTNGLTTDNWQYSLGGGLLMIVSFVIITVIIQSMTDKDLSDEMDELRTDLALLQNRCDWIEDDICKEYQEKQAPKFSHNIEDDFE